MMTNAQRIAVNTSAQYIRTGLNVILSLYATRLVLSALGQSDYGIYTVIAGVVSMLAFLTNALVVTTQRYISFEQGKGNTHGARVFFGNSLLLHLLLGIVLFILLMLLSGFVTQHFLRIEPERYGAATMVYFATTTLICLSLFTAPYRALYIAHENIVYISIIDVIDGILRLLSAIAITYIDRFDKLSFYSLLLISIGIVNLLAFALYAHRHYHECHIPKLKEWNNNFLRQLSGFAGWTIYSTGCILTRTQGMAILINRFFGSVLNASYGIALQVSGAVHFISQSIINAFNPQIVKAEGKGNREAMLQKSELASKYATLLLALVGIPIIFEMPEILNVWLGNVPEKSVMFCQAVLIASICDQTTIGLASANQAVGHIRNYSIFVNTIKVLTLPAAWLCLHYGLSVNYTMYCFIVFEIICAITRLPFLKQTAGLSITHFFKKAILPILAPLLIIILTCYCSTTYIHISYRFLITISIAFTIGSVSIWYMALTKIEQSKILQIINRKTNVKKN